MPRLLSKVPSYSLHKASGQAVVSANGRDIYLGKFGTPDSRAAYDRVIAEWLASGRQLTVAHHELTVDEVIAKFWELAEGHYRKNGQPTRELENIKYSLRPLCKMYGDSSAQGLGPLASSL